ncbi:hypothetical protein ACFU7T_14370 [Streptomyces sp. NPDC057555]|uniref:hypothetical protein n=1 Tax=Streptomyces sp. NPDC057555 TaxID=3346166 RepID=UPI003674E44B
MRWPWQSAVRTSACPQPRLLPSATDGVCFEAVFTITWRPKHRTRHNTEQAVRTHVHAMAAQTAVHLDAADLPAAQDAVNAALTFPHPHSAQNYRLLTARTSLRLPPEAKELIAQRQTDENRIRRLHFLKAHLYDHPDLVVLDRLEHHAPGALHDEHVAELQRLARLIKACDRWWSPLLEQWEKLGEGFNDTEKQQQAMLALLDSLKTLNGGDLPPAIATHELGQQHSPFREAHP